MSCQVCLSAITLCRALDLRTPPSHISNSESLDQHLPLPNLAARVPPYAPMGPALLDLTKSATIWHFVPGSVHLTVSSSPWMSQVTGFHVLHPLAIHLELRNMGWFQIVAGMNGATNEQPRKCRCLFRAPTLSHLGIPDNGTAGSYVISIFVLFYRKLHSVAMISVPIYIPPTVHPGLPSYTSSMTIRV